MHQRRSATPYWLRFSVVGLLASCGAPGARAQGSTSCKDVTLSGLGDDFPADLTVYTNTLADDDTVRGQYVSEDEGYLIWYAPGDPTEWTANTADAALEDCTGRWVVSQNPRGDSFTDTVWYESAGGVVCDTSPDTLGSDWTRMAADEIAVTVAVTVECSASEDDSSDGLSSRSVVVLLIVIGVGFMALMCLGALACCIHKGKHTPEDNVLPEGELPEEGSVIGGKAGEYTKPGLHAHPEVQGAQHPRPEDWAPSYTSNRNGAIPTGSRSGPSVRSIGYS